MPKWSNYTFRSCALMDHIKVHLFFKVQGFHQSEDHHVAMENRKYRLLSYVQSKDNYREFRKSKNDRQMYNKQPVFEIKVNSV